MLNPQIFIILRDNSKEQITTNKCGADNRRHGQRSFTVFEKGKKLITGEENKRGKIWQYTAQYTEQYLQTLFNKQGCCDGQCPRDRIWSHVGDRPPSIP